MRKNLDYKNTSELIELAKNILNAQETEYYKNKELIKKLFIKPFDDNWNIENINLRLTVIDSFYSTNMQNKYFGIEELSHKLKGCEPDDFINYIKKEDEKIRHIFNHSYGFGKPYSSKEEPEQAPSLISKYAYFLTKCNFPIYDRFVNNLIETKTVDEFIAFFRKRNDIKDYDSFDNFAWLFGKISSGSMYLVLNKENLMKLFKEFKQFKQLPPNTTIKSKEIDKEINLFIKENYQSLPFSEQLKSFIRKVTEDN